MNVVSLQNPGRMGSTGVRFRVSITPKAELR